MTVARLYRLLRPAVAAVLLTAALPPEHSMALELTTVLENTRVLPPARVRFREERHNRMLKEAFVLTGYLEYPAEGHLYKIVESPFRESFRVLGDRIEVSRDGRIEEVALIRAKGLHVMLAGIEAIIAGQAGELQSLFECTLSGKAGAWAMQLKPRLRGASRYMNSLYVTGNASSITSIRVDLKDDEWFRLDLLHGESDQ